MIRSITSSHQPQISTERKEFSRILSAAVINRKFRQMLLTDPVSAISNGYKGECFELNNQNKSLLSEIRANSLADFAAKLTLF